MALNGSRTWRYNHCRFTSQKSEAFHNIEHPRQLIKLAGLTLRENSSGQHKGQKRISKRGRRKLRALLFRVMMPMIRHNEAFRTIT